MLAGIIRLDWFNMNSNKDEAVNNVEMPKVVSTDKLNKKSNIMKDVTKSKSNNKKIESQKTNINSTNSNVTSNTVNETVDKKKENTSRVEKKKAKKKEK